VNPATVATVAGLISNLVDEKVLTKHLLSWLKTSPGAMSEVGVGIRRAVLAVVSRDNDGMEAVLEKAMANFGEQLFIKHAPMLQQEGWFSSNTKTTDPNKMCCIAQAQILLLTAGYVQRTTPMKLRSLSRSVPYLNSISNRIAASQVKARFLGLVVGEAISTLTQSDDKRLNFHMEEMETTDAIWYKKLVYISDQIGPTDSLRQLMKLKNPPVGPSSRGWKPAQQTARAIAGPPKRPATGFVVEEVDDDEDSEDADLVPYAKPDSDAEDSDDDPTLVRRDKPKAPVYIRDLIIYLRDSESYDRQKLALTTAPTLIRRKGNHGMEVKEHAEDLASQLVGLQDNYDIEDFDHLKLQSMIAIAVAQPQKMGNWFSRTFFEGDYSLSQRAMVMAVLGISAREVAGFDTSEYASAAAFPSKRLPERVEQLYIGDSTEEHSTASSRLKALPHGALDSISHSLEASLLAPIAANAADAVTGPDVFKLSSFSSRLQQDGSQRYKSKAKPRIRAIPNATASLIATAFFFPLTSRFQAILYSPSARLRGVLFQPFLLTLFIKTLAILLHAAGPSTLALPDMTAELWSLCLGSSVQAQCAGDLTVTHAVLFALLTMLEVNENRIRDICQDMAREVVQTQEWVTTVMSNTRGGDGGQENDVRMLAAGVLIRLQEGMQKYQTLLMGEMIG
jgi:telomere length regulation protein